MTQCDASADPAKRVSISQRRDAAENTRRYDFSWTTAGALASEAGAWRDLAENAVEPNPVYGANFLVATEKHLRGGKPIRLLIARDRDSGALAALAPIETRDWSNGFPGRAFRMFVNPYVTLTHPLIRRDDAPVILAEMLRRLAGEGGPGLLHFPFLTERRGFVAALTEVAKRDGLALSRVDGMVRPAVEPEAGKGGARYAQCYVSKSRRSNNDRRLRRLRETGVVDFRSVFVCETGGRAALEAFLELERASWKGAAGTALLSQETTRAFAHEAFSGANQAPRVRIRSLTLNGRPIAMALDLESQGAAYAFKAAFDPAFAHFSPGLMLDAHTASEIGENCEIRRLDSFAQTEVAQAAVWRQEEPVASMALSLSANSARAESLARRLRVTAQARNHAKRIVHRGREITLEGARRIGGPRRAAIAVALVASLPVVSIFLKNLL